MTIIVKTPITQILTGNAVAPSVANQPHADLEANIDDILAYISTGTKARLNYNNVASSGLNFAYTSGDYSDGRTLTAIAASSVTLAATNTNYVQIDTSTATVITNTTGWVNGNIPLWIVTTDASNITGTTDARTIYKNTTFVKDTKTFTVGKIDFVHDGTTEGTITNTIGNLNVKNSTISGTQNFYTTNSGGTERLVASFGNNDASVSLYHEGQLKFSTTNAGATVQGTLSASLNVFATDSLISNTNLVLNHNSTNASINNSLGDLYIQAIDTSGLVRINTYDSGDVVTQTAIFGGSTPRVRLFYADSEKFITTNTGTTTTGTSDVTVGFSVNTDFSITHDTANGYIENKVGEFSIRNQTNAGFIYLQTDNTAGTQKTGIAIGGGTPAVTLYYDGSARLSTTSAGGTLTGTWNATTMLSVNGTNVATVADAIAMALALGG